MHYIYIPKNIPVLFRRDAALHHPGKLNPKRWVTRPNGVMANKRPPPVPIQHEPSSCSTRKKMSDSIVIHRYPSSPIATQASSRPPPSVHRSSSPRTPGETCRCPPHYLISLRVSVQAVSKQGPSTCRNQAGSRCARSRLTHWVVIKI